MIMTIKDLKLRFELWSRYPTKKLNVKLLKVKLIKKKIQVSIYLTKYTYEDLIDKREDTISYIFVILVHSNSLVTLSFKFKD